MEIALVAQQAMTLASDGTGQAGGTRLLELSRSLAGKGHRVTVYAQRHGTTERAKIEPGVTVKYIGSADGQHGESDLLAQVPAFSRPLHECLRRDRPDVVHAMRWTSGLAALAAARDLRIPVVQSFDSLNVTERRHHVIARDAGTERIRLEPAIGRSASAVLAGSSDEESDLTRLGVPRRSIRVVPCGVDTDEFTPEGPVAERATRPRLVTVADLSEHDVLATLLHAMAKVPGADLVVAGGPARANLGDDLGYRRLSKLADSLGVSGQVTFAGQPTRAALPPLLRSADLVVSLSEHDPTGVAGRPGHGVRHAGHRLRGRRPGGRRDRRHHRHPGPARPPGAARAADQATARPPDAARGVQRGRGRPGQVPVLLGPDRARDPRRLRQGPRRRRHGRVTAHRGCTQTPCPSSASPHAPGGHGPCLAQARARSRSCSITPV